MLFKKKRGGKIFISYRRSDARGVAGRLADSLEAYFGDRRVFRDIEDISGGADFHRAIEETLRSADAVIVLIGPDWLTVANETGERRLDEAGDFVFQEIASALELGIPLFPVLIEDTPMPRREELPEALASMLRYNALTVTDRRWRNDVLRLGKTLAFDIPSANRRKLDFVRLGVSIALCASLCFTAGIVSLNALQGGTPLIAYWQSGVPFVVTVASSLFLLSIVGLVAEDRQIYLYAGIAVGSLGSLFFFALQRFLEDSDEPIVTFFGATVVVLLMFVFMNLSGFEEK